MLENGAILLVGGVEFLLPYFLVNPEMCFDQTGHVSPVNTQYKRLAGAVFGVSMVATTNQTSCWSDPNLF